MADSALTAALLQSQTADPTALMINPQMQLAQSMLQQGLDASPIRSPWQGFARLAQVMAGQYGEKKALERYGGATTDAAADMAQKFPEGSAMRNALMSKNMLTRSLAMQQAGKALLQLNEPRDISPAQQTVVPGASGPVATNTNPMSPTGQAAADLAHNPNIPAANAAIQGPIKAAEANAQNQSDLNFHPAIAGGVAAAEAPYKTVETKTGAVLPLTAIPGIGMPAQNQPPVRLNYNPVNTAGAQQPPAPMPQAAPGGPGPGTATAPAIQPAVPAPAQPQAQGTAPPNQFGGGVRALPGGVGIMAPSQDTFKPMIDEDTKEVATDREKAISGQNDMGTITAIRDFLPQVKTGWTADTKLQAGRILQAAGVDPKEIQNFTSVDPANGQVLQKKFLELSTAAARQMGAREPGSVIQMFTKAYPSIETTPEAINLQTNALYMNSLRQQKMAQAKTNFLNESVNGLQNTGDYRGLKGFNEKFNESDSADNYLRAAEAMSDAGQKSSKWSQWAKVSNPDQQHQIISLIPQGQSFMGPDGKTYVRN